MYRNTKEHCVGLTAGKNKIHAVQIKCTCIYVIVILNVGKAGCQVIRQVKKIGK